MKLKDKVAIITGASGGLGSAMARAFAAEGAKLVLTDIADNAVKALAAETGGKGHAHDEGDGVTRGSGRGHEGFSGSQSVTKLQ